MGIKFIFSELENDLKKVCIERAVAVTEGKQLIIVPEQNTLSTDAMLIEYSKNHAFLFSNVLSFKRLAFYVLNETEGDSKDNLSGIGQTLVIKKVLHEVQDDLLYFKNAIARPGFASQISETINQMSRYAFKSEDLQKVIDIYSAQQTSNTFRYKLHDLNIIYNRFFEKIKENYLTNDDLLQLLTKNIKNSKYIKDLDIYITSFYSFSVLENMVIRELGKYAKSLTIAIPQSKNDTLENIRQNKVEIHDFYHEPKQAVKSLLKVFDSLDNVVVEYEYLETTVENEEIKFIKENFNKFKVPSFEGNTDKINFFNCNTKYSETALVAKLVKSKVEKEGYRYKDIVIVCPDFESYGHILKNTFNSYNIPIFYDKKDFLYKNRVIESIRSAYDAVLKNMKYESIFRFLKSGVVDFETEQINYLENYIIEYGIRGYMWGYEEWRYGQNSKSELKYDIDEINSIKNRVVELLSPLKNKKLLVSEHCENLYGFLEKLKLFEYIENKVLDENTPINLRREYELVWDKLIHLLEQMHDVLGEEKVTLEEFFSIFDTGVREDDFGHIPTYDDQVVVANINRSKIESAKIMIFMDASDKNYPKYTEQNIIFDSEECDNILNTGYRFLDSSLERLYAQNLVLFLNIAKVEDSLIFTKSKSTLSGDVIRPAKAVDKIMEMLKKSFIDEKDLEENKSKEDIKAEIASYKDNEKVYNWYKSSKGRIEKELFYSIESEEFFEHKLSKTVVEKLYGNELLASVSKLEKYVQCPYAYFLNYNIKGKPKKVYEATSMDYGQLFHLLFELFIEDIRLREIDWNDITEEQINLFVDEQIEFCLVHLNKEVFLNDNRYKVFLDRICAITKVSIKAIVYHIKNGKFENIYSEASFKNKGEFSVLNIKLNERNIRISGEIDRVDLLKSIEEDEEGNKVERCYVKIIDYKSSDRKFELDKFYHGLQLQLVVYLDTVLKNQKTLLKNMHFDEVEEAGFFYFTAKNPIIEKGSTDIDFEAEVLKEFRMNGIYSGKDEVVIGIDTKFDKILKNSICEKELTKEDRKSHIFPAEFTTKNDLSANSTNVEKEDMSNYRAFANNKIKEIGENIFEGNIEAKPSKFNDFEYCTFCDYKNICKIELKGDENKFNEMHSLSKEEINNRIRESL